MKDELFLNNKVVTGLINSIESNGADLVFDETPLTIQSKAIGTDCMMKLANDSSTMIDLTKDYRTFVCSALVPSMRGIQKSLNGSAVTVAASIGANGKSKGSKAAGSKGSTVNYDSLQSLYGFTDEEMQYLKENYSAQLSQLYGACNHSSSDANVIYNNLVAKLVTYHGNQMTDRYGRLKMVDICAYMNKEPLEISESEYLALCKAFDRMDNTQKEQFIKSGFKCEKITTDCCQTGGCSGYYQYTRSETFEVFTSVYIKNLGLSTADFSPTPMDGETEEDVKNRIQKANKKMDNYNLLYAVTYATDETITGGSFDNKTGSAYYDDGDNLKISINEVNNQYKISLTTYHHQNVTTTIENDTPVYQKEFTIYKYENNIGKSFTDAANKAADGLRVDIDKVAINNVVDFVSSEMLQEVVDLGEDIPFLGEGYTIAMLYADIEKEKREGEQTNAIVDIVQDDNNASYYLSAINCAGTLIVDQDGNTYITASNYDVEKVSERVETYNALHPDNQIQYNEDTFITDLLNPEYCESLDPEDSTTSFFDYWNEQENMSGNTDINTEGN